MTIPGQTFPVNDYYLEDVLPSLDFKPPSIKAARNYSAAENDSLIEHLHGAGLSADHASTLAMLTRAEKQNYELIGFLVAWLLRKEPEGGAILVFTSGVCPAHDLQRP